MSHRVLAAARLRASGYGGQALVVVALSGLLAAMTLPVAHAADSRSEIADGLEWLHSFEYERALAAFERVEQRNPRNPLGYWGQAMCYQQLLWGRENVDEARAILVRMRRAGALSAANELERGWLATLDVLFGDGDRTSRLAAYASAMEKLAAAHPKDPDVAAFYGLSLIATRARGLAGHHSGEEERPQLVGSPEQQRAAVIFQRILRDQPRHPGALHYLIHVWDDPEHAHKALAAARVYANVVPESSHARHMPAHVFVQLGMWDEAIAADEAAAAAAQVKVVQDGLPVTAADFHPLSWLIYEYAQVGRFDDARRALARLQTPAETTRDPRLLSLLATLRSRLAIEAGDWTMLSGPNFVNVDELFAVGFSAAQRGDTGLAEMARVRLTELAHQPRYAARRVLLEIMALQVGAVIRTRSGDVEGALGILSEATAKERALPVSIGPPALIKPAQEQYAEQLLDAGRIEEARTQFEGALARARNRRASARGLERIQSMLRASSSRASTPAAGAIAAGVVVLIAIAAVRRRRTPAA